MKIEPIPWLPDLSIEYLESIVRPEMTVFEWGAGGSTLFLAERVSNLVSIEHDPDWYHQVTAQLLDLLKKPFDIRLVQEISGAYVDVINTFSFQFDLILVDGRARPACLTNAAQKVAKGGWIVLDNSGRPHYQEAIALFSGWEEVRFRGKGTNPITGKRKMWCTSFWRRD
jgi:predicted O-methyltransferase YrrM